ncbi:glycosyltransferase [Telmatobacter bradus]|uniref:glycosyltransferase n=1 Tax=Telmatobacter bradus TaxID=474953 RepID=UPI003B435781
MNSMLQFYGYVYARTGYGSAARNYVKAFDAAGINLSVVSLDSRPRPGEAGARLEQLRDRPGDPTLHLWHTEPNHLQRLSGYDPRLAVMTTWEADRLPQCYVEALNRAREVWVPCHYNQENFRQQLQVPVYRLPHPVTPMVAPRYDRAAFDREMNLPAGSFVFVAAGTWQERKNLDGIIEAFLRAFPQEPDVLLLIKTNFAFTSEELARREIHAAIARANPPSPDQLEKRVRIFPLTWPEDCLASLMQRADCFVSLHRGEGWCYPLFDAAAKGTPTISTAHSGPLDYLDARRHRLVEYKLTAANQREHTFRFAFDSTMQWAEPNLEHATACMREVYEKRTQAKADAVAAACVIQQNYSLQAIGQQARAHLLELEAVSLARLLPQTLAKAPAACTVTTPGRVSDSPWQPSFCS